MNWVLLGFTLCMCILGSIMIFVIQVNNNLGVFISCTLPVKSVYKVFRCVRIYKVPFLLRNKSETDYKIFSILENLLIAHSI